MKIAGIGLAILTLSLSVHAQIVHEWECKNDESLPDGKTHILGLAIYDREISATINSAAVIFDNATFLATHIVGEDGSQLWMFRDRKDQRNLVTLTFPIKGVIAGTAILQQNDINYAKPSEWTTIRKYHCHEKGFDKTDSRTITKLGP